MLSTKKDLDMTVLLGALLGAGGMIPSELSALKEKLKTEFDRVFKAYRKAALVVTLPFLTPYNNALNFIYN